MKHKYKLIFPIVILFIVAIAVTVWPNQVALTVTDGKTGRLIYVSPIEIEERFAIQFIHSIHKTPVYEEYYIDSELHMVLDQVTYESLGVGNPSAAEPGQTFMIEDGKYKISNINRKLPHLDLAIAPGVANHQLGIRDNWIPMTRLNPPGNWARLETKKVSFLTLWKGA
ncbi:hypothetical protein BEP19_00055 [Ammoniphilus oxalaticus]|uniref:RocC n=1 Tax=Ammoniphilus oxalaticus TaxID=66863 RepID=A0A419SR81_9BACL|nr:DUF1850 domain-containing protein [Ammoniphilus oxalaticus]RKD27005.1 hypothetical protein BEP19_00055 [Ammoniphilus oxalaticus]